MKMEEEDEDEEATGSMQQPAFSAKAVSDKDLTPPF